MLRLARGSSRTRQQAAGRPPMPYDRPLGQLADGDERDRTHLPGELTAERFGQPATEQRRRNIGVEDDDAHEPARREAYRSARNSAYSSSEANGSSAASWSTDLRGLVPCRRISASVATKSQRECVLGRDCSRQAPPLVAPRSVSHRPLKIAPTPLLPRVLAARFLGRLRGAGPLSISLWSDREPHFIGPAKWPPMLPRA